MLCLISFRSWRAAVCIIVPLMLVSVLCNALMPALGIGLKVAALPVIALGVGVGVDYGIYLFERIQHQMRHLGQDLRTTLYPRSHVPTRDGRRVYPRSPCRSVSAPRRSPRSSISLTWACCWLSCFLVNVLGAIFFLPALAAWLNMPSGQVDTAGMDTPPIEAHGD